MGAIMVGPGAKAKGARKTLYSFTSIVPLLTPYLAPTHHN
jgi:hypothetical protein